jgi:hypothetical protein
MPTKDTFQETRKGKPKQKILIHGGKVKSIYKDGASHDLLEKLGGKATITRASHVEAPTEELQNIEFTVDLTPSGGPVINGFKSYTEAVDAEVAWLNENTLNPSKIKP